MSPDCTSIGDGRIEAQVSYGEQIYDCKVWREKPGVYRIQYKHQGPGIYKVWIRFEGRPVKGSPFIQNLAELGKPTAQGEGLHLCVLGNPTSFIIDPSGFTGQISVAVYGPSKSINVHLQPENNTKIKAIYCPTEKGHHTVHIHMDGKDIEGSPYRPLVIDEVNYQMSESLVPFHDRTRIVPLKVNKTKYLQFDVSDSGPGKLSAEVKGPNGKLPVIIDRMNGGFQNAIFAPRDEGVHYIYVNWCGNPLSKSPYVGWATNESDVGEHNTHLDLGQQGYRNRISSSYTEYLFPDCDRHGDEYRDVEVFYESVKHAYKQQNSVSRLPEITYNCIESPTSDKLLQENTFHRSHNACSPSPESYLKQNSLSSVDSKTIFLRGKGLKEAEVNKPARFTVDASSGNIAPRTVTAYLQGEHNNITVTAEQVRHNVCKCTYIPKEPGVFLLHISWGGKPLKGSPFQVNVHEGTQLVSLIPSMNPGYDTSSTILALKNKLGYIDPAHLWWKQCIHSGKDSQANGDVRVWGPGIENGILSDFDGTFWVDTSEVRIGDMRVQIVGPKGAFDVKQHKAKKKNTVYQFNYNPIEQGIYTIDVQIAGVHVGGSPFVVLLATSTEELGKMRKDFIDNSIVNDDHSIVVTQRVSKYKPPQKLSSSVIVLTNP